MTGNILNLLHMQLQVSSLLASDLIEVHHTVHEHRDGRGSGGLGDDRAGF